MENPLALDPNGAELEDRSGYVVVRTHETWEESDNCFMPESLAHELNLNIDQIIGPVPAESRAVLVQFACGAAVIGWVVEESDSSLSIEIEGQVFEGLHAPERAVFAMDRSAEHRNDLLDEICSALAAGQPSRVAEMLVETVQVECNRLGKRIDQSEVMFSIANSFKEAAARGGDIMDDTEVSRLFPPIGHGRRRIVRHVGDQPLSAGPLSQSPGEGSPRP